MHNSSPRRAALIAMLLPSLWLFPQAASLAEVELPSIGQPSDRALSPTEEVQIGAEIISQLRELRFFLDDLQLNDYLRRVGHRLASNSGHHPDGFNFYLVRDKQINAFALPGGHIGVNAGLILASDTEDELAGVLAHEIAHVTQRHIARQIEASSRFNLTTAAALLIAVLAGASDPDVVQAALTMGMASSTQQRINFTRSHEMEADRIGIRTLAETGYDPKGMASFFQKMEERARLYGSGLPEILRTHPVSNTRISEALARVDQYSDKQPRSAKFERDYRIMQARLRVYTESEANTALAFFKASKAGDNKMDAQVREYGLALAHFRTGHYDEAIKLLSVLADQHPDVNYYHSALADSLLASGQGEEALKIYQRSRRQFPNDSPLILAYANALILTGNPGKARSELLGNDIIRKQEPETHRLLALAARDLKREAEAHYQMAEYHRLLREYRRGLNQLNAGLRLKDLGTADEARLKSALQKLRAQTPETLLKRYDRGEIQ